MDLPRTIVLLLALAAGCTALDFFGFRDDAPLHVVSRPDGYPTALFGAQIAPTFYHEGDEIADLVAVSGGRSTPTIFYRLSSGGDLVDVADPWDEYLMSDKGAAESAGSGAALAGLPTWADRRDGALSLVTGCVAIGEPDAQNVHVDCEQGGTELDLPGADTGEADVAGFGREVAAIRPTNGAGWLLAASSDRFVTVFSAATSTDRSAPMYPAFDGGPDRPIVEVAAGALADRRIFVAAATADEENGVPPRVHLFLEDAPASPGFTEVACVDRPDEAGFGGAMTTGDLELDGDDELIVSAGAAEGRVDAVYVYEVADLAAAAPTCAGDAPGPTAIAVPGDGPLDVSCRPDGACDFGAALAVGDLATDDGGPELIVGAPGARVDGKSGAGAVYVFRGADLMADGTAEVAGRVADSAPEKGQRFGGGVAAAAMAGREELIVGAIGKGKVFIAYCTGVGEDIEDGADVTSNARGKVVSTRCRPR
jgi:hypothetical protein